MTYICHISVSLVRVLKCEKSQISHDFLLALQSCYLIPTIDKPTHVRTTSATLIDNIFINNPDKLLTSGNIISDVSDHFSQFCITTDAKDKTIKRNSAKIRDYLGFSVEKFNNDLSQVDWDKLGGSRNGVNKLFSTFYNKYNKIVKKHVPIKKMSNRKAKQLSKPWITKGIKVSISIKNKLYAIGDNERYRRYRNLQLDKVK